MGFIEALGDFSIAIAAEELHQLAMHFDYNGDGTVILEEFMELLKKEETAPPPENSSPKLASNFRRQAWEDEDDSLGPLPPNWQKAVTPGGKPYFINHSTQSTTWDDPR